MVWLLYGKTSVLWYGSLVERSQYCGLVVIWRDISTVVWFFSREKSVLWVGCYMERHQYCGMVL